MSSRTLCLKSITAAACGLAIALTGCAEPEEQTAPPAPQVSVVHLALKSIDITDDLAGRVAAVRVAEIRAQVSGIVQHRLFEQGAEIQLNQPLFQINPAPFKADRDSAAAALLKAQAVADRARLQVDRLKPLATAEAVSGQVYDDAVSLREQASADLAQARATLARRQLDLRFSTVDAPIAGRIDQALVTEGALVGPSDTNPMARIQQIDQVYVDVRVPASAIENMRPVLDQVQTRKQGVSVDILRTSGGPYEVKGRILFSGINVDTGTGEVLLRIQVDNAKRNLLPGMFVRARVPRGTYPDALMVPQQAVSRTGGAPQVWVVDDQNKAYAVSVELGEQVGAQYRIRQGLRPNEKIVVEGMERLSNGIHVAPRKWQDPAVAAARPIPAQAVAADKKS